MKNGSDGMGVPLSGCDRAELGIGPVGDKAGLSRVDKRGEVGSLLCALSSGRAKAAWLSAHTLTQTGTLAKPQTTPSRNRVIPIKAAVWRKAKPATGPQSDHHLDRSTRCTVSTLPTLSATPRAA